MDLIIVLWILRLLKIDNTLGSVILRANCEIAPFKSHESFQQRCLFLLRIS